jgi:predicted metal-dependent phosphoesterase TrpH
MLEKINRAGMHLTIEDVEKECMGDVIGRPHVAAALVKKGYVPSVREAFGQYLSRHMPFYTPLEKPDIRHAAKIITGAGGKAVLAHPGLMNPVIFEALAPNLAEMGFWGIEAYHPAHTDGQCVAYESVARRYGLYVTAGSDFHGSVKPDVQIGQERRGGRFLEKSLERLGIG